MSDSESQFMASIYSALAESNSPSFIAFIKQKSEELGISVRQFSRGTEIPLQSLQRILSGEAQKIDLVSFLKISQFLGIESREFIRLYVAEMGTDNIRGLEAARKAGYILRTFDIDGLKRCGFLKSTQDFEYIESRIRYFFKLESIFDYDSLLRIPLFSRTRRSGSDKMLQFWCSTVYYELQRINNPNPYDPKLLRQIIPKIRVMTRDESMGLLTIARALYAAGVTVIAHTYVNNTQIRGATFVVNGKPCIVLQDFGKNYATLWFTLVHELYHVWKDFDRISHLKYHLSGDGESNPTLFDDQLTEDLANEFAGELLLPSDKRKFIAPFISVPGTVSSYADKWGVHEGIIYGQYSYHHNDYRFTNHIPKAERAVRHLMVHPWAEETIDAAIAKIHLVYT